ncbi:hypothetical protein OIU80_04655 [Flavobacterium sp. LS1R47]|jgi:hypothetical protein|uniref:Uncharacterized protein n=1 Tax=Flavobacterium frigoritolerans TaxID=2987686 RepID=A0A9X2ZMX3_9FLAO|nr:hypothetical protein [Flavobacterium frigoritolerans]MCV9931562.1 hypothetical protein [Flavobacterium frigoritolerans]
MSENKLSKETEIRLTDFFNKSIDPKSMAKAIRQVNHTLSLSLMRGSEIKDIEDDFYWLNKLAEALDPYLDVE